MFIGFIVFAATVFCSVEDNGSHFYTSPIVNVPNPCYLVRHRVSNSGLVVGINNGYNALVLRPSQAVSRFYSDTFGEDTIYGWSDDKCYTVALYEYSWPFRSVKCVWFATWKDYACAFFYGGLFLTIVVQLVRYFMGTLYKPILGNTWGSLYIDLLKRISRQPIRDCANVRSTFVNTMTVGSPQLAKNHSHPTAARCRTLASRQCELICAALGTTPYFFQKSRSDERRGKDGCRTYFWGRDAGVQYSAFNPPPDSTYCMIDVDYYLDMPYLLGAYPNHYMISTLQPAGAAYTSKEYQYTFKKDNSVHYTVSGGAVYDHQIWNYNSDVIVARARSWTRLWYYITCYNVDRRQLDDNHQLISLTPMYYVVSPFWSLSSYLTGSPLERLSVVSGEFARMDVLGPRGLMRSTAKLGSYAVANIPVEVDDSLAAVSRMTNVALTMAQVRTTTNLTDVPAASALAEFHRSGVTSVPEIVCPVNHSVNKYQYYPDNYDPDVKNKLIPFMSPFIPGCYSPDNCLNNDRAAVKGRITDVKAPEDLEVTPFIKECMEEFIIHLIPEDQKHKHFPVDLSTVYDKQPRPAQQAILKQAEVHVGNPSGDPIITFQKDEAYAQSSVPRIISTIPGIDKLHYSSFIYSFTEALRSTHWYAFGKTPLQIAKRVAAVCIEAVYWILKTDFSRMDGRIGMIPRLLERLAMLRWFHPSCHARLIELMETQKNKRAVTKFGIKYDTEEARLSGSPETADFNSMDDAFIAYMAYRKQGLSPKDAYAKLGIFGGDDGCTADLKPELFESSAAAVGQLLEVEKVCRGEPGVQMLSREYSTEVWFGDPSSMCDIKRQLSKLHTTSHFPSNIAPLHKFAVKVFSYSLTDGNTPIFKELAKLVIEKFPEFIVGNKKNLEIRKKIGSYFSHMPKDVQFPNENHNGWMDDVLLREIPTFNMLRFQGWIKQCFEGTANVLAPPLFADVLQYESVKQKSAVVINGDVLEARPEAPPVSGPPVGGQQPKKSKTMCKHFALNSCSWGDKCKFSHVKT